MVPVVPHAMTPHHLAHVKQKLPANLHRIPAADNIALANSLRILQALPQRRHLPQRPRRRANLGHVLGPLGPNIKVDGHTQLLEQLPRRVGEDGERAAGELLVLRDQIRRAAADDEDGRRDGDAEVVLLGDGGGEGLQVGLAGAAVEVADEEDELPLVQGVGRVVKGAEGLGRAVRLVDGEVVDGGEGGAVRAVVRGGDGEVRIRAEAREPIVGVAVRGGEAARRAVHGHDVFVVGGCGGRPGVYGGGGGVGGVAAAHGRGGRELAGVRGGHVGIAG